MVLPRERLWSAVILLRQRSPMSTQRSIALPSDKKAISTALCKIAPVPISKRNLSPLPNSTSQQVAAWLLRAAGIPARVVIGYQGGELNPMGNYLIVRQSDAHAWTEVWLEDSGWTRVDPTSAVAPERIDRARQQARVGG